MELRYYATKNVLKTSLALRNFFVVTIYWGELQTGQVKQVLKVRGNRGPISLFFFNKYKYTYFMKSIYYYFGILVISDLLIAIFHFLNEIVISLILLQIKTDLASFLSPSRVAKQ